MWECKVIRVLRAKRQMNSWEKGLKIWRSVSTKEHNFLPKDQWEGLGGGEELRTSFCEGGMSNAAAAVRRCWMGGLSFLWGPRWAGGRACWSHSVGVFARRWGRRLYYTPVSVFGHSEFSLVGGASSPEPMGDGVLGSPTPAGSPGGDSQGAEMSLEWAHGATPASLRCSDQCVWGARGGVYSLFIMIGERLLLGRGLGENIIKIPDAEKAICDPWCPSLLCDCLSGQVSHTS